MLILETNKVNLKKTEQKVFKPECIVKHTINDVDLADQYLLYYSFLRKSIK